MNNSVKSIIPDIFLYVSLAVQQVARFFLWIARLNAEIGVYLHRVLGTETGKKFDEVEKVVKQVVGGLLQTAKQLKENEQEKSKLINSVQSDGNVVTLRKKDETGNNKS